MGTPLGAAAALARGRFERGVERACDLVQAFPSFILALAVLSAVRAPSRVHIGVVFALTAWAPFARLALAQTRVLRDAAFVEAARRPRAGARRRSLARHIVPNLLGVVAVQLGSTAAAIVVSEAALAFVGLGPRDGVSLGGVLDQGVAAMLRAPHVLVVGAVAVVRDQRGDARGRSRGSLAPATAREGRQDAKTPEEKEGPEETRMQRRSTSPGMLSLFSPKKKSLGVLASWRLSLSSSRTMTVDFSRAERPSRRRRRPRLPRRG